MKIREIFKQHGESYFRRLETETGRWLEKNVSRTIISTGGGFVNVPNLKNIGVVVHLYSDFEVIITSILDHPQSQSKLKKRPLLKSLKKARKLFDSRLPVYRGAADFEIDVTATKTSDVARAIIQRFGIN